MKKATEGSKMEKLIEAIEATKKELSGYEKELAAATDPQARVNAEKHVAKAKEELAMLERSKEAAEALEAPEPVSDMNEMLEGLKKYETPYQDKIDGIQKKMEDNRTEFDQTKKAQQKASEDMDAVKMVTLNDRLEELNKVYDALKQMKATAEAAPIYPEGAIEKEWDAVYQKYGQEWENRIEAVRTFAEAYDTATRQLIEMSETIEKVKRTMEWKNGSGRFAPHFTEGKTVDGLIVEKPVQNPLTGKNTVFRTELSKQLEDIFRKGI